jgi:beta-xylosidase
MAQDFQAAFQLSADDRHISVGDEGGVALAAIQGLNQKVELENAALRAENEGLKLRLAALEKIVLNHKSN